MNHSTKSVFKAEDFDGLARIKLEREMIAERANARIAEIIKDWPKMYCHKGAVGDWRCTTSPVDEMDTHTARLAFIEPIAKAECEHEVMAIETVIGQTFKPKCKFCGVKLKATWSVVE